MTKAWIKERKQEYYYRKAVAEKYRSRSAYKLLQANRKYKLVKKGDVVVDLGAAPGGWLQVLQKLVGDDGYVLGVDVREIQPFHQKQVCTIIGDVRDTRLVKKIFELLPRQADIVVSDTSPNISGIWELDHARQLDLATNSFNIATSILKMKGHFFIKVFQGDMLNEFIKEIRQTFKLVKLFKPKASRTKSAELYIVGIHRKKRVYLTR